jgi:hypothetical protein
MYVNNGTKSSQGDVQKMTVKQLREYNEYNLSINPKFKPLLDGAIINCYMLDKDILDKNPDLTGDYNVPRAIVTFNKRIEPLMVAFKEDVRNSMIVDKPSKRGVFTTSQCELISGYPLSNGDQDSIEDLLTLSDLEIKYWEKRNLDPNYIYDLAESGWENYIN